ncbi:beta-1,6-N-acetylglucosaminyltransferase [Nostoc sp. UHCC 0302]|uniref:beta-1,6-N-acetylglucosaminyltransferase n=1 Tax=Nostoc sp. UHCC 0302 TaxID=3134896 RepID=UPI00311CDD61
MNLAYLVLAHNTPNHLCRLINALNSPDVHFFIHIDYKSDNLPFLEKINHQNVTFIQNRVSVYWGEFSQVEAILNLIKEALNNQNKFDYLILMSGSDYPLKSAKYINYYLTARVGTEFINLVEMPNPKAGKTLERFYKYQPQTLSNERFYKVIKLVLYVLINKVLRWRRNYKKVLGNLKPYGGSTWWVLSADACQYILSFTETNPEIVNFFKNTWSPDESFFHTIIGNSKFRTKAAKNLTFAQWKKLKNPEFIDMEQLQILLSKDKIIATNTNTSNEFLFARKFKDESLELTDFIDNWIKES